MCQCDVIKVRPIPLDSDIPVFSQQKLFDTDVQYESANHLALIIQSESQVFRKLITGMLYRR